MFGVAILPHTYKKELIQVARALTSFPFAILIHETLKMPKAPSSANVWTAFKQNRVPADTASS